MADELSRLIHSLLSSLDWLDRHVTHDREDFAREILKEMDDELNEMVRKVREGEI